MGGLGCPVAEFLTRSGIGTLGIVDHDTISLSNIHRQSLYNEKDINQSKVKIAKKKLNKINPKTKINIFNLKLNKTTFEKIIKNYDYIVDGTDNFESKFLINDLSLKYKKIQESNNSSIQKGIDNESNSNIYAVILMMLPMFVMGLIYNSVQGIMPKLFEERMPAILDGKIELVGAIVGFVYAVGAVSQILGGYLADKCNHKLIYLINLCQDSIDQKIYLVI